MAQQYSNALAPSESAPVIRSEPSKALIPTSAGLVDNANGAQARQSLAVVPSSSQASTALMNSTESARMRTAGPLPQTSTAQNLHEVEEAWPLVTRSLMVAVMGSQPPTAAASTLLGVFRPLVDGWASAGKEGKRWKERAEIYMAEHHRHKVDAANKHDALQAQLEGLQQSLAESEREERELESQQSTLRADVSSLEKRIEQAEAEACAAKDAHAQEAQESKKQVQAMAKSAQDAKLTYEKLRQEGDNRTRSYTADISKLQDKVKETEAIKAKLEEQLGSTTARTIALEGEVAQKGQEIASLQTRVSEITTRKEALERQLALYQRAPYRRY